MSHHSRIDAFAEDGHVEIGEGGLREDVFGSQIPFAEPYWYQGYHSPYYNDSHREFRAKVRKFVEDEIKPNIETWIESPTGYPADLHIRAYQAGIHGAIFPVEYGGTPPERYDAFHELILWNELARAGGGSALGQLSIDSMAFPPVSMFGTDEMKAEIAPLVATGRKHICLAISEPSAGSDVANIKMTAERDGDHYVLNGQKKWITGGAMADYFTMAVRTGKDGMGGISLLLVPAGVEGLRIRKMKTQFSTSHNTTFLTLDDVRVPAANLIGQEGMGFRYIVHNFNHERFVIAAGTVRQARLCYEEAFREAMTRKTFGKTLMQHQMIRFKLAEMARMVEALYDSVERAAYQFSCGVKDINMGGQCSLLKVNASKTFEYCAREAAQIFGGSALVREGRGQVVERLYREVRMAAIPGGSEEILLDMAIRGAERKAKTIMKASGRSRL